MLGLVDIHSLDQDNGFGKRAGAGFVLAGRLWKGFHDMEELAVDRKYGGTIYYLACLS